MTFEERVKAVAMERFGPAGEKFTPGQARFLVLVMLHAGVCMKRHYLTLCGRTYGKAVQKFFARLVAERVATPYAAMHRQARVYHVHHKRLYRVIGQPDSRLRKPRAAGRAMERLMVLDAVLERPEAAWLATEQEKMLHFTERLGTAFPREWLPHVTFGEPPAVTRRYFVEHLPVAVEGGGQDYQFLFLATSASTSDVRAFIHRHAALWRALPRWRLRVLLPPHLRAAQPAYVGACQQELSNPLRSVIADELRWYFEVRQRESRDVSTPSAHEAARLARAGRAFRAVRFRSLYRAYRAHGPRVLEHATSPVLSDALQRGTGHVSCDVLTRPYLHLSSLVGTA
jgi:hypothetical protein